MRARARQARVLERFDAKAVAEDEIVHLAIEVAAAGKARPQRIEPVLPACHSRLRRAAVLDEAQRSARPQNAAYLGQRERRIRDRSQGPGRHDGVDAVAVERDRLGRCIEQRDRHLCV